ncbi:uncharacterized protein [Oryctolagus cuniculus]|uniref:uncharacterized protein isoform X2 n=1 Tax=Oryctolagus cuniculus TaxID=9986 RepID=UPI003879EBB4
MSLELAEMPTWLGTAPAQQRAPGGCVDGRAWGFSGSNVEAAMTSAPLSQSESGVHLEPRPQDLRAQVSPPLRGHFPVMLEA